jgi:TPR repeat protein
VNSAVGQTPQIGALHQQCLAGVVARCVAVGILYEMGLGVERNDTLAVQLYRRACDGGIMDGCMMLGSMYRRGRGVAQNDSLGIDLFHKACDGGSWRACDSLREQQTPPRPRQRAAAPG